MLHFFKPNPGRRCSVCASLCFLASPFVFAHDTTINRLSRRWSQRSAEIVLRRERGGDDKMMNDMAAKPTGDIDRTSSP